MGAVQLELFPLDELSELRLEIAKVKKSSDNVRRGMFARHGELLKLVESIKIQNDIMMEIINRKMENEIRLSKIQG